METNIYEHVGEAMSPIPALKSFYDESARHLWVTDEFVPGVVTGVHPPDEIHRSGSVSFEVLGQVSAVMPITRPTMGRYVIERMALFPVGSEHIVQVTDFEVVDDKVSLTVKLPRPGFEFPIVRIGFVIGFVGKGAGKSGVLVEMHPGEPFSNGGPIETREVLGLFSNKAPFDIGQQVRFRVVGWHPHFDDLYELELA